MNPVKQETSLPPSVKDTVVSSLVLASGSPYRKALLHAAGIAFTAQTALIDETLVLAATPKGLATARAAAKAEAVAQAVCQAGESKSAGPTIIIGCDQVMEFNGTAFDKVDTPTEALLRLRSLAGQTHSLHSAYCLYLQSPDSSPPLLLASRLLSVDLPMRSLTTAELTAYVATGEWQGSVGCYQFENRGAQLFEEVRGDQATIIGLPVQDLTRVLRSLGVNTLLQPQGPWRLL